MQIFVASAGSGSVEHEYVYTIGCSDYGILSHFLAEQPIPDTGQNVDVDVKLAPGAWEWR